MSTFSKLHADLIALGLPLRLAALYGELEFMAGTKAECWPTHSTLANRIGMKSRRHLIRLLRQLQELKLIEWKRERYRNRYRVLKPDPQWIADLMANPDVSSRAHLNVQKSHISDVPSRTHRKESVSKRTTEKNKVSQPASSNGAGRLADIASLITASWPTLPGYPGPKLIGRIDAILGDDIPPAEFAALLRSRTRKATSFGLAESLARELRDRRNGDSAKHQKAAAAQQQQNAQDIAAHIRFEEATIANPRTSEAERALSRELLNDLRKAAAALTPPSKAKGA